MSIIGSSFGDGEWAVVMFGQKGGMVRVTFFHTFVSPFFQDLLFVKGAGLRKSG